MSTQFSIDHIEVSDSLIEVFYWISHKPVRESLLFKTGEFEAWLSGQREIAADYWSHWRPEENSEPEHYQIWMDIEQYFMHKMQALSQSVVPDHILASKKPMSRVSQDKKPTKDSRSA